VSACDAAEFQVLFETGDRLYRTTDRRFRVVECRRCRLLGAFERRPTARRASTSNTGPSSWASSSARLTKLT